MCIWRKTSERLDEPPFIPVFKPRKHELYILRHCTSVDYITNNGIATYHYIFVHKIVIMRRFCTLSITQVFPNEKVRNF